MCGICGELRLDNNPPNIKTIQKILKILKPRGPNSQGIWQQGPMIMGAHRLAILDLTEQANQPFIDEQHKLSLVFNGVIYNYKDIRKQLIGLGYKFKTKGDTEVILKSYAAWGKSCVERLSGMFAFALYDSANQKLHLVRDRMGIKPLYWAYDNHRIVFSSTLSSLLMDKTIDTEFDTTSLHYYFSLHGVIPPPKTLFLGIKKVPPGHWIELSLSGNITNHCYWKLQKSNLLKDKTEQDITEMLSFSLTQSIRNQFTTSDLEVGLLLSGGMDSSLLLALMTQISRKKIKTFSIGFEDTNIYPGNEFEHSDLVSNFFDSEHLKIFIENKFILPHLQKTVLEMNEPFFSEDTIGFYLLTEEISKQLNVVLTGQGADEVFAGYPWHPELENQSENKISLLQKYFIDRDHNEILSLLTDKHQGINHTNKFISSFLDHSNEKEFLDQFINFDTTILMSDDPLKRIDSMTMGMGVEARSPYLDHNLVELAFDASRIFKLKYGGKGPLKLIAQGLLPNHIINRPQKAFPLPYFNYFQGDILEFSMDILSSSACMQRDLYQ